MKNITVSELEKLARLSSLKLSDEEKESLRTDLSNILGYVDQLSEVNTDGVEPTYQVTNLKNVWREDEIGNDNVTPEELIKLAGSNVNNNQIKVPKVL